MQHQLKNYLQLKLRCSKQQVGTCLHVSNAPAAPSPACRQGLEYISTAEHKQYPFTATQWHPEKPPFEFGNKMIPHTRDAVRVAQHAVRWTPAALRAEAPAAALLPSTAASQQLAGCTAEQQGAATRHTTTCCARCAVVPPCLKPAY